MDLEVTRALRIPGAELSWRFSRASGPGGQHVNTSDSRVELSWDVAASGALSEAQRARLLARLAPRLTAGTLTVAASERRSQLRNREAARARLAALVREGLAPDAAPRRATRPGRGAVRRRLEAKARRSDTKRLRRRPPGE
ncbi:aminoacyl-tRNA hydrolase [Leucobacter allii]|uniref:alternative ribosome rescue aminoacyl-tRNA hydrolase ArfB n=1 Tax=Leucobacter allii TaxID=2932247 RepID=UPI001FD02DD0|nr:alternative ribosome rescue aminoacyl-tRNA hydrolase ArfB [Leucobacter allii]UOR02854.1 aminoacyl-tRNA hydrolase [Leucobacter allii]